MKYSSIRYLLSVLALLFVGVSCTDNSTGAKNSKKATFKGKVENTSYNPQAVAGKSPNAKAASTQASGVKGAIVTAAVVKSNGNLKTIGSNHAKTNAKGEYTLKVDVSGISAAARNRIVIIAENNNQSSKAFVTGTVQNGSTVTVQPITLESSAEAGVYQKLVANGNAAMVSKADIELAVGANVAAAIQSNEQTAANIAAALASYAKTKSKFYAQNGIKITDQQRQTILNAKQNAEVTLVNKLNAATSAKAKQNAFDAFMANTANAELKAGIKAWAVAESDNFAGLALLKNSTSLSANAQNELRKHVYFYTAIAEAAAVKAQAKAAGASKNTINAIVNAGNTLQASIKNSANASVNAIASAFAAFNNKVQAAVKSDSSLNGSAFAASNIAIGASGGLKSTLESELSSAKDIDTILSAYSEFSSAVNSMVKTNFTGAGNAKIEAYSRLLVLINLAS